MLTFFTTMDIQSQPEMPEWMREERYMFCDQTVNNHDRFRDSKIWKTLKAFFA